MSRILVALVGLVFAVSATAAEKKAKTAAPAAPSTESGSTSDSPKRKSLHDEFSGQGFGTAGCGLGSIVFGEKPGIIQIFAATSNGLWGNQTFAITSGTSNCETNDASVASANFIQANEESLKTEIARGEGESINTLAQLLGCRTGAPVGQVLQKNYSDIVRPDGNAFQMDQAIKTYLRTDSSTKVACEIES